MRIVISKCSSYLFKRMNIFIKYVNIWFEYFVVNTRSGNIFDLFYDFNIEECQAGIASTLNGIQLREFTMWTMFANLSAHRFIRPPLDWTEFPVHSKYQPFFIWLCNVSGRMVVRIIPFQLMRPHYFAILMSGFCSCLFTLNNRSTNTTIKFATFGRGSPCAFKSAS